MDISRLLCRMCREKRNKTRDEEQKKNTKTNTLKVIQKTLPVYSI